MIDPDDPRPVDVIDPDDPRPLDVMPTRTIRPSDTREKSRRLPKWCRPRRRKAPRCRPTRKAFPLDYSGNVVVRLSAELDLARVRGAASLSQVATVLKLRGLRRLLKQYRVTARATRRLVDIEYQGKPVEPGQIAGADWSDACQGPPSGR